MTPDDARESLAELLSRTRHPVRWEYRATSNTQDEDYAQADALLADGWSRTPVVADMDAIARVLDEAADALESEGKDTYWRDDAPFHAAGRFWTGHHAEWLRNRALLRG